MGRNIKKDIDEYQKKFLDKFYTTDAEQIAELVRESGGKPDYYSILYALQAGYMVGYRKGKRDSKA